MEPKLKFKSLCGNCKCFRKRKEPYQKLAGVSDLADGQCALPVIGRASSVTAWLPWRRKTDSCESFTLNSELTPKP